ncbi:MAG: HNH endonuclease [Candidatus Heimdallarchaeota archaeon]
MRNKPKVCDYCKINKPIYHFKSSDTWCCEKFAQTCLKKKRTKEKKKPKPELCDYGCGNSAKFYFPTPNKWCCEKDVKRCPEQRQSNSKRTKIAMNKPDVRKANSEAQLRLWRDPNSSYNSTERSKKISKALKGKSYNIGRKRTIDFENDFPIFCKVEEIRNHPTKNIIQVHCKNHLCENSKEKEGWFTPSRPQLYDRIWAIENDDGNEQRFFYCSEKCKIECPLYNFRADYFLKDPTEIKLPYTQTEYNLWRSTVLERDEFQCLYCGNKAEHVHHIIPVKLGPAFSLDPDNGISVCKQCHFRYAHRDNCSTGKLAKVLCQETN